VISGGTFKTNGSIQNISDMISDKTFITGTTQESRTEKKRKRHGYRSKRIRVWGPEVFMTPSITEENVKPIGTIKEHAEDRVSNATIKKVNDSLDPYGLGGGKGKASQTIDGLSLPTEALYQIHPDITANALIETDPAFTNRKNFLSSQFMIDALANNPERRSKRLGDGFYEQQLINEQIVSATGKQYLEGYTDNEAEYKALLEAGVAFGKAFKLTPGIALSKEQMDAITTDMVWLETKTVIVDGKAQQVLYPKVYLAKQSAKSMDTMGGIISGKAIVSNANTDILNQGIMTADTIVLGALDVENTGRIDGRTVTIKASQDVINTGNIHGDKQVYINAGRDINVGTQVDRLQHQDIVGRQGTIGVGEKGDLVLSAKRDINLKGAIVHTGDNSKVSIDAGQNINVTTEALSAKKDMTVNSDNYNRTDRRTELGTAILSDSNVTLRAGNDVNIRNGIVNSEHGLTSVEAGNDVTITNGKSYSRDEYGLKYKEKSLLSRTTNIIRTDHEHTGVLSSTIGGDTINVKANRNVSVTGSNILGTNDVLVSAGNDVRTDSGEETQRDDVYQYSKKSGLMGAGIGFTIGSKKVTDTTDGRYINQVASNIASSDGEINVKAGNAIHSTTTNYFSNQPADLSAQNVTVDGKHNTVHIVQSHEEKRSGLTVSVGGQIVNELNNVQQLGKRANSRKNSNLSTLEYLEAANTLKHAYNDGTSYKNAKIEKLLEKEKDILAKADELNKAYQAEHPEEKNAMHPDVKTAINNINNRAKKDRLLNVQVGIGSSKFKQLSELKQENYIGSSIGSKNKVSITANSDNSDKGNIQITGSVIEAPEVNLNATNNLSLDAGTNSSVQHDTYTSSGWSVGATVSPHGNGVIGLEANVYKGKENALETTKTHTGTVIRGNQVNTISGNDTDIIGSKIIGDSVSTKVGHDLKIESLQDTNDYHKVSKNKGISVSYGMSGPARVGFDNSRGTTDSHYASVTNQAGIYAGDGGYNVQVNNATTLTGGIIKGSTDISKNKLSSNSLSMNDIHNEASYSAKTSGYSLSTTKRSKNNPIGITGSPKMGIPVKGNSKSTTHSAISKGIIEVAEKESLEKINHDTEQALNKLAPIFDKKTVEEKQILLNKLSEHGYKLIGDVSVHQQTRLLDKAVKAKMKGENAKADKYYQESKKWGDNGIYKISLHASLGGFLSNYSGSNIISGVKASAVNESLQSFINKSTNPEFRKIISLVIGKVVSGDTGGALAEKATTYNWLEHQNRQDLNYDISQLLFTNAYGYDEDTRWSKLREKVAYYYALMEYERDYHDYYDSDNLVHTTDGGHIGEPYYTDESYSALLNNLFAYVVGSDPNNINYYTHLKEYYYNKFVSEEKYIQDKGYNVRTYDAGWQEDDGQYYNKLINGGTVLNGRFRGKQLELEGYPTVLGDDGQTYYTLDENGRPWYNPNPSNEVKIQLSKEKQQLLVTQRLHKINENSKIESNNESYTVQDGEKALESLYNQIPKIRKQYNGAAEATEIFLYAGDKSDLIGKYGIVDVKGSTNDIQTVVIDKDSVLGQTMVPSERMKLDAIVAFMTILKEKGINIDNTGQSTINSHLGVQSVNQYLTVGTYLISPRVFYDEYNDVYYGTMIVADRWDNGGKLAKLGIISFGEYNNPIHNAYVIQVTNLRKPYNNEVHDIPFSVSGRAVRERL
jgi:filamentous hemagglutinin family outer membrane protein